jgi:hypothetical protein
MFLNQLWNQPLSDPASLKEVPMVLKHIHFSASPAGKAITEALDYLSKNHHKCQFDEAVPLEVVNKIWHQYVLSGPDKKIVDPRAYTFCVLDQLRTALKRRDVFVHPSWRYADPRSGLLSGSEWEAAKQMVSCTLGYFSDPKPVLDQLATELDQTYRIVAARLPTNSALRFEGDRRKEELILSPLERNKETESLVALRKSIADRMPRVDLTEILLEITARTGLADAFTHVSEQTSRAIDLDISLCAVMIAEACNRVFLTKTAKCQLAAFPQSLISSNESTT